MVTAPVFGTAEKGVYSSAELFAGPNKFGSYYNGVLPNGRIVKPAGTSIQVGMNPLGVALTPDGRFLITSNDDEREGGFASLQSGINVGGYSLTVVDTNSMSVVSQTTAGTFFIGLQVTGSGPYTVWASGGPSNDVKLFTVGSDGKIAPDANTPSIAIKPVTPANAGYVSNYTPSAAFNTADSTGNKPAVPSQFTRTGSTQITFPAGSTLSPDGKFLYVACNGDNSVAVIDVVAKQVVRQVPVGFFPYTVSVSPYGDKIAVSNWGVTEYKFKNPTYDSNGNLTSIGTTGNVPEGYFSPLVSTDGSNPKTSSVSILLAPAGNGAALVAQGGIYTGHKLDGMYNVGDTHPSAMAIVRRGAGEVLYVAKTNSDSLGMIMLNNNRALKDFDLTPLSVAGTPNKVHGSYPNALAVSPDNTRLYVAEAGLNSVAVLDTTDPLHPKLLGRIPTAWYPTALTVSSDGKTLFVANAKGIGEDINPKTDTTSVTPPPTGVAADPSFDSNFMFGTLQKVDLTSLTLDNTTVLSYNYAINAPADTSIVPAGGAPSSKITHVFFILHENKTFDSMLGNLTSRFGPFASLNYNDKTGAPYTNIQNTGVSLNTQTLATTFATAVNYYSESEESDAGHQFCGSGTASDYTEKTLLVKSGRGLLVNKNFEPEDYPEGGYIFNNAARNSVSFKDYGAFVRIQGTDTGTSTPTLIGDPTSGNLGYPMLQSDKLHLTQPLLNAGDVDSETQGLGQAYFMTMPMLQVMGTNNPSGEPRLDLFYPGYNFNISDQRRAKEFIADFDGMVANGTLPQFLYIYQPNDHTGGVQAPNASSVVTASGMQQIADGDVGLGMVVSHIMQSPVYYDPTTGQGSAIFVTYDDAQSSIDHIHLHRTPLIVISPYAKPGYTATRHYSTASIVKTEELLLGLPPNNLGDLLATDLRDMFQSTYNGITASKFTVTRPMYQVTPAGRRVWTLVNKLDTSAPDRDSFRLGALLRLSAQADTLYNTYAKKGQLGSRAYRAKQFGLYQSALKLVNTVVPRDNDDK